MLVWAARQLIGLIPMEPWIAQVVNVLIIVLLVLAIVFYVVIPILQMLGTAVHIPSLR